MPSLAAALGEGNQDMAWCEGEKRTAHRPTQGPRGRGTQTEEPQAQPRLSCGGGGSVGWECNPLSLKLVTHE